MSTLKVDGIRSNSATSDAITLASDGTCTANITNNLSNRNLIINGAMQVAQRGTSSTSSGIYTVDRFKSQYSGQDEAPTQAQADVASGTTPYSLGFRKSYKITNGNQTSVNTSDYMWIQHRMEAQNIANSGWNYTSASSFITLSFWVKSSVAQDFKGYVRTLDGTSYGYPFATGSLTADTWTKITKTIPGNSNLQVDNNNENGLELNLLPYLTTSYTDNSVTENAWAAFASGTRAKDTPSTWWTTNDATFEITGLQLEVGSVATDFEHRSYAQELALSQRYFQFIGSGFITSARGASSSMYLYSYTCPVNLRASPTVSTNNDLAHGTFTVRRYRDGTGISDSTNTPTTNTSYFVTTNNTVHLQQDGFTATDDRSATIFLGGGAITLDSEL